MTINERDGRLVKMKGWLLEEVDCLCPVKGCKGLANDKNGRQKCRK